MPQTSANVHNLNDSRAQALEALSRVSDRLGEILGESANLSGHGTGRNEHGELVNEEGLPIIDITEPIDDLDTPSLSAATEDEVIEEDSYPEPISNLSPEALAISRKHRDKILELLEDEEAREERRTRAEQHAELERKRESARIEMQKRMVTQSSDLEKRRRARELDKKMAKALINGLGEPEPTVKSECDSQLKDVKEKKSVTFASLPASSASSVVPEPAEKRAEPLNWGDVVPGRLSKKQRPSSSQTQPMKMEVVERVAAQNYSPSTSPLPLPSPPKASPPTQCTVDSDDESDSELDSDTTIALESGDEDVVLSAHRHRELALEYHRRREALASSARDIHPEDLGLIGEDVRGGQDNWDAEDVPLEATLAHPPPKAPVSKFKASFIDQADDHVLPSVGRPSTSHPVPLQPAHSSTFGISVLPPSTLSKSVKMGKLVDGNLVAGDEDEDEKEREEREEEEIRKLLLKSMEEYSGIASQVLGPKADSYWAKPEVEEATSTSSAAQQPAVKAKPKASRFKVNRAQARTPSDVAARPSAIVDDSGSGSLSGVLSASPSTGSPRSSTPLSGVERSSPKLSPADRNHALQASSSSSSKPLHPTIIDSPSFAPRRADPSANTAAGSSPLRSHKPSDSQRAAITSPSFQAAQYTIMDSPSFVRPKDALPSPHTPLPVWSASTTMTDDVKERSGGLSSSVSSTSESKSQRVSRFKAERGG